MSYWGCRVSIGIIGSYSQAKKECRCHLHRILEIYMDAWTWRWFKGNHWYLQTPLHLSFATRQFFDYVEKKLPLKVKGVYQIPHQLGSSREVWDERVKAAYYECWQRGGLWRLPQRAIFSIPQYSHLKHLTSVPWTMKLGDHFLVILGLV